MSYRTRIYYTDSDKTLMWDRWQAENWLTKCGRFRILRTEMMGQSAYPGCSLR